MFLLLPRKIATERGIPRYFTGVPCKHGHICEKYTKKASCVECSRFFTREHYKDPENLEKKRIRNSAWNSENRDLANSMSRDWQKINRQRVRDNCSRWKSENKDKVNSYTRNRRAKLAGSDGYHSADDVARIIRMQRKKCASCRLSLAHGYHVDHIKPVVLGGSNGSDNIQVLCPRCNMSKGGKDPLDWAKENGKLL